jgi:glycosyltransferase involved in cell wall biosynthesis
LHAHALVSGQHEQAAAAQDFVVWMGRQAQNAFATHQLEALKKVVWVVGGRSFKHGPIVEVRFVSRACNKSVGAVPLLCVMGDTPERRQPVGDELKRLIYLSPVPLDSPSQRPHHFVAWAHARWGCEVWWVQPYPVRLPRLSDMHRLRRATGRSAGATSLGPSWRSADWLRVVSLSSVPLEPLLGGRQLLQALQAPARRRLLELIEHPQTWLVVGKPSGLAMDLCAAVQGRRVLYDVMDDVPLFSRGLSQRWMKRAHAALLAQAQAVWGSAEKLVQSMSGLTRSAPALVRNGTLLPELATGMDSGVGSAAHASAPIVLGYVGTLASWFDWQALGALAAALPHARIDVYGPQEGPLPAGLPPQVRLHGAVPHAQVFGLMRQWHAGLIPFVRNALTDSVDPVKYYEYRSCGLPVLTTLFGEMPHHALVDDGVWDMADAQVIAALEPHLRQWHTGLAQQQALGRAITPDWVRDASWSARFEAGAQAVGWGPDVA